MNIRIAPIRIHKIEPRNAAESAEPGKKVVHFLVCKRYEMRCPFMQILVGRKVNKSLTGKAIKKPGHIQCNASLIVSSIAVGSCSMTYRAIRHEDGITSDGIRLQKTFDSAEAILTGSAVVK